MLSYRHSFHAGNFADVVKHVVLVEILEHLIQKEKPFEYIDTHSGAGLYNLQSDNALKLQEHANGIGQLNVNSFPELERYFEVIQSFNSPGSVDVYPGSPAIAQYLLRQQDRAWLFELHPQDFELLRNNMVNRKRIKVRCEDGFEGLNALLPPSSRRGLVLIDPSYEIKSDYELVIEQVVAGHRKFSNGIYAIWYPVVDRQKIEAMESDLSKSGIKNIQRFELGIAEDTDERGMTSSGMIVINPPWKLFDKMSKLLPKLAKQLTQSDEQHFKCDVLSPE
ncbi:23S rRNA (adenine(2030)-N(6))-methyltransferase RlmJ [Granulosicoccus sp.]|nr:23S rRNA (adenine(2030)-N(6))-methyltransferase RlmJ [Granulosicoccus sp.]MDB4224239.1 23S rRNA (adenine(2030)-N(6))-methyltransferase RlmJ [Granulosicoccus sp.]